MLSFAQIGAVVLQKKDFNFDIIFSGLRNCLALEKDVAFHLNNFESPLPMDALCQVWLNWSSASGKEVEKVKSLQTSRRTNRQTDRRRTTGGQKSSLELSARVS